MVNPTQNNSDQYEYIEIAQQDELTDGDRLYIEYNSKDIVVINISGKLFAIEDICTHDDGPLGDGELDGEHIICPRHGARFDVCSGKALTLPAVVNISTYPVRLVRGKIEIGIPKVQ